MIENVQALQAISVSQQVAANNIANVNTNGFRSSRVEYESGPNDQGVQVQSVTENTQGGPLVPTRQTSDNGAEFKYDDMYEEGSNTDLATEMVNMIQNEEAFAANAAAIHTDMNMTGVLINMMV